MGQSHSYDCDPQPCNALFPKKKHGAGATHFDHYSWNSQCVCKRFIPEDRFLYAMWEEETCFSIVGR